MVNNSGSQGIELLAPAKTADMGIAAVNFGADAVYIGPEQFGARSAAGNSLAEIQRLVDYAHLYFVKVFVTVNTILFNDEMDAAVQLIYNLHRIGVDAVIIQDVGLLEMDLPPIPIHLSTQGHHAEIERIQFFDHLGVQRIVLARELSISEIMAVCQTVSTEVEAFIHGALCVCFSGQCYMSAVQGGRSGNRGECAQPCRKAYDLFDANGKRLLKNKHVLSIKDLNLTSSLSQMIEAGVTSLKIEGRLKDISYIKNIVGHYRQALDSIINSSEQLHRASSGKVFLDFEPDPDRTFNRKYTSYFSAGRKEKMSTFDTPKSMGKKIGKVVRVESSFFEYDGDMALHNGDGLIFLDQNRKLQGIHVNTVDGRKVNHQRVKGLFVGAELYRNLDIEFDKLLQKSRTVRKIDVKMVLSSSNDGFVLVVTDEDGICVRVSIGLDKEISRSAEGSFEQAKKQLGKLGNTIFKAVDIQVKLEQSYFLPGRVLNELRRDAVVSLEAKRLEQRPQLSYQELNRSVTYPSQNISYKGNVVNEHAKQFYHAHGVQADVGVEAGGFPDEVMVTKMCLKYELGECPVHQEHQKKFAEPLTISDGTSKYALEFDCERCVMIVRSI